MVAIAQTLQAQDFIIITGLSGAGKSHAVRCLEDMGYFCVDNMPAALIPQVAELCRHTHGRVSRVAVVTDARGIDFPLDLDATYEGLRQQGFTPRLLYLEASEETLIRRFKETRRRHPLATRSRTLLQTIRLEQTRLRDLRERADKIIDTSATDTRALKHEIAALFSAPGRSARLMVTVCSFGYKHGVPLDADLVFDVRFLRNPHYVPELQPLTGVDHQIEEYVMADPDADIYLGKLKELLEYLLPKYTDEGKAFLTVAIGCTGGRHRSVVFARLLADYLKALKYEVTIEHRDSKK